MLCASGNLEKTPPHVVSHEPGGIISMLDGTLKTLRDRSLWIQRYGIFASRQNLRHDPVGGFWLLCRAHVLLHTVLQFVFEVPSLSRQVRLSKLVKVAAASANALSPISATPFLEALTRNRRSNFHRCENSLAIATASGFKCDRGGTRPILFSWCGETVTLKVERYGSAQI